MQFHDYNENQQRGTIDFPFEFYHVDYHYPRYIMNYHWHIEYEFIRILEGELHITLDEKHIVALKGDILFINSGILHSGTPIHCVYECLVFDMKAFTKHNPRCKTIIQEIVDQNIVVYHHFKPDNHRIHTILWNVFDAMAQQHPGYELIVFGEIYHFLGTIYTNELYFKESEAPQTRRDRKRITQLKNVLELIESSYASPITLDDLASAANMSSKYFCKFFSEMTHQRPMDYLNRHRIEHACYELSTSDNSVTEIAFNCGFNDLSYFIKTFKKYKGVTPGKYLQT